MALALLAIGCSTDGTTPIVPGLETLPDPGTNTAVAMLLSDLTDGTDLVAGGELLFYDLVVGSIPHALTYDHRDSQAGHLLFVISELYQRGVVTTNGTNNRFAWTGPGGTEYRPASECEVDVIQAFVLGQDSEMIVHTVCEVAAPGGRAVTVLAKANRFQPGFGGP